MKLFISQSGPLSLAVAEEFVPFVRQLAPGSDPWLAPQGISKGARWGVQLAEALKEASAGMVCLTRENLKEPWLIFEAGALSRQPSDYLWTFLLDVKDTDLGQQLDQFQNTKATKDDVFKMIQAMNRIIATAPKSDGDLVYAFNLMWPPFEKRLNEIRKMHTPAAEPVPNTDDVLLEILSTIRQMGKQSSTDNWRIAKTMALLSDMYERLVQLPAPSLEELNRNQLLRNAARGSVQGTPAPLMAAIMEGVKIGDIPTGKREDGQQR